MKKIQASKLRFHKEKDVDDRASCSKMPIIKCDCGAEILVVPDLAAMDRAIKTHLAYHKGANERFLVGQILDVASRQTITA
jgi:hypothetical protein